MTITANTTSGPEAHRTAPRTSLAGREIWRYLGILVVFVVLAWLARQHFATVSAWLDGLGPLAPLGFLVAHALLIPVGFPVSILGFLAGASFGMVAGTALLTLAGLVSGTIMYWLGRGVLSRRVRAYASSRPRLQRFLALAEADSVRLMILLRLSPLHFGLLCYLMGAGRTRFLPYLLTTAFVAPSALLQAYLGHTARVVGEVTLQDGQASPWQLALMGLGLVAVIVLSILLGRITRKALAASPAPSPAREGNA